MTHAFDFSVERIAAVMRYHLPGLRMTGDSVALAGYPATWMAATGAGAGFAANGVNIAHAEAGDMNEGFGTASDVAARMDANATGMFNAQAPFKSSQDQIAAS